MKKIFPIVLSFGLLTSVSFSTVSNVDAAAKSYKNCTELNKDYRGGVGGVARAANVTNKGGKTKYKPYVSKSLYDANTKLDRDKDYIACEK
ncbi:excalibur calcium-binding domain-containing protein [Priestia megaterium]|uniref:excalibur calcium-binding domain-containing protein n=1 Tax=Priestia megaterium TaxID=1404 RepID=UPI002E1CD55D|nr:excalibur calcium-binding domain-containing protein [Priestia megaterium]